MQVIYYGLKGDASRTHLDRWINITGNPTAFTVGRESQIKQNYLGKYNVITIDEALVLYPEAQVWVTFGGPCNGEKSRRLLADKTAV